jgi:Zn-dependent protease/CBS domain-containing protein
MTGTILLGRLFGFEIRIHWSWLFIFFLITWTFANFTLKELYEDWDVEQRSLIGAVISLIFFLSILMHEVSHSIMARRYGIPVSSITLFVFGGVSSLTKEPESPRQEFWIAIVGPLTSFAAAGIFTAGFFILDPIEEGAAAISLHLALINFLIGVFNLVPGFPLDGGRVLRSAFWATHRDRLEATRISSKIGEYVAYGIMAIGVAAFFFVSVITGVWFFLIGNFLRNAAIASYGQLFVTTVLKDIPVSTLVKEGLPTVAPNLSLTRLAEDYILAGRGRAFPVVADKELLGLITLTDLHRIPREEWATTSVARAMTPFAALKTSGIQDDLATVFRLMASGGLNQIPLVEGKSIRGLVTRADLMRYLQMREEIGTGSLGE